MSTVVIVLVAIVGVFVTILLLYLLLRHRPQQMPPATARANVPGYVPHAASSEYYRPGDRQPTTVSPPPAAESRAEAVRDPRKVPLPRCPVCDAATAYDQERCPRCGHVLKPF